VFRYGIIILSYDYYLIGSDCRALDLKCYEIMLPVYEPRDTNEPLQRSKWRLAVVCLGFLLSGKTLFAQHTHDA